MERSARWLTPPGFTDSSTRHAAEFPLQIPMLPPNLCKDGVNQIALFPTPPVKNDNTALRWLRLSYDESVPESLGIQATRTVEVRRGGVTERVGLNALPKGGRMTNEDNSQDTFLLPGAFFDASLDLPPDAALEAPSRDLLALSSLPLDYRQIALEIWQLFGPIAPDLTRVLSDHISTSAVSDKCGNALEISDDNQVHLSNGLQKHWEMLFCQPFSKAHLFSIEQVAAVHKNINLPQSSYISAYGFVLNEMLFHISDSARIPAERKPVFTQTVIALVFLDMNMTLHINKRELVVLD